MKKNITINMFGQLFNIDEDAYQLLSRYLMSMKQYFQGREGGEEIAEDIERHVAELMWQHNDNGQRPVSIEDINDIVSQIGSPSEIDTTEEDAAQAAMPGGQGTDPGADDHERLAADREEGAKTAWDSFCASVKPDGRKRTLFRDPQDKLVGGVCSGLAHYFGWDAPVFLRLGFVILTLLSLICGSGYFFMAIVVLYVAMMIIMPMPVTVEDRLKMRGEEVTAESLNQEMLRESNDAVQGRAGGGSNAGSGCLVAGFKVLVILLLMPVLLFLAGFLIFAFLGIIVALFAINGCVDMLFPLIFDSSSYSDFSMMISNNGWPLLACLVAVIVVVVLPLWAIVSAITHRPGETRRGRWWLLMVWILAVAIAILSATSWFFKTQQMLDDAWRTRSQVHISAPAYQYDADEAADSLATDSIEADTITSSNN